MSSTQLFKGYSAKHKTQYLILNFPSLLKSYFTDIVRLIFMMLSTVHIFLIKMCYLFLNTLYILSLVFFGFNCICFNRSLLGFFKILGN